MIRAILYQDNAQYDVLNIYLVRPFICFKLTLTANNHFYPILPIAVKTKFSAQWLIFTNFDFHWQNRRFSAKMSLYTWEIKFSKLKSFRNSQFDFFLGLQCSTLSQINQNHNDFSFVWCLHFKTDFKRA